MSNFSTIEQIAFQDGRVMTIDQLPEHIRNEVVQYNTWTAEASRVQDELNQLNYRASLLSYARTAAFGNIQEMANALDRRDETHTPVNNTEVDSTDTADPE